MSRHGILIFATAWLSAKPESRAKKSFWGEFKRVNCEHPYKDSNDKVNHVYLHKILKPHDDEFDYAINVVECLFCGMHFIDEGVEFKD